MEKWWTYQRERFPLSAHAPLVLAFSSCAVCYSALLRGSASWPSLPVLGVAFGCCLISFLHLRIADEFKDFEEDSKFRPYRAVPRGLVTLGELGVLWVFSGLIQLLLALLLSPYLVLVLLVTWMYLALMSKEFFVRDWITRRPITYMWSHMLIMPLIDFYATSCDWLVHGGEIPEGLIWFVIVSFFNGFVIEVGRKIRAPEQEETGVNSYSALWGIRKATMTWLGFIAVTGASACIAASQINFLLPVLISLGSISLIAVLLVVKFNQNHKVKLAGKFELFSGLWTLVLYLLLGVAPMFLAATLDWL